jgi:hypothetical protein
MILKVKYASVTNHKLTQKTRQDEKTKKNQNKEKLYVRDAWAFPSDRLRPTPIGFTHSMMAP